MSEVPQVIADQFEEVPPTHPEWRCRGCGRVTLDRLNHAVACAELPTRAADVAFFVRLADSVESSGA